MQTFKNYGHIKTFCIIGYGSIGKGILPLIKRHFTFQSITVIDPQDLPKPIQNVKSLKVALSKENYKQVLDSVFIDNNSFCVNVSVQTSSFDIMTYCQQKDIFYIDTVKEEWLGFYSNLNLSVGQRTNYALRHRMLSQGKQLNHKKTAISCCGANPGMVSWFVKQALINIAKQVQYQIQQQPKNQQEWGKLMMNLGVKGIHIAQRDTQKSNKIRNSNQFWNTWSVDGFISQGFYQAAELGWGTHEKWMPLNASQFTSGPKCAIYLDQPGWNTQVKSWCPTYGPQYGLLVTHDQAISIAQFFTVKQGDKVIYRPTVHYAYHPIQQAIASSYQSLGSGQPPKNWKILSVDQITEGADQLGVLLYGHQKNAYWYGSQLDIHRTKEISSNQNATGLQVTSAILAGMVWAIENPHMGIVQPDQMDYKRCLQIQRMYIEPLNGYYTDWTPLKNQRTQFGSKNYDFTDPWQFKNMLFHK